MFIVWIKTFLAFYQYLLFRQIEVKYLIIIYSIIKKINLIIGSTGRGQKQVRVKPDSFDRFVPTNPAATFGSQQPFPGQHDCQAGPSGKLFGRQAAGLGHGSLGSLQHLRTSQFGRNLERNRKKYLFCFFYWGTKWIIIGHL